MTVLSIGPDGMDAVHLLLLVLAAGACLAAFQFRQGAAGARARLLAERDAARQEVERLRRREEMLEAARREAEMALAAAGAHRSEDEARFARLAQDVLSHANRLFLERADEAFRRHREGAQGELRELIRPIGENFDAFRLRVDAIERVRSEDKSALQEQVRAIQEGLRINTAETGRLVNALTAPKGGGRWGEMTLRNVMEQAGLSRHCDFAEQVTEVSQTGRQRPDAIINIPGGRQIIVDAKVSLDAYMAAASADDPDRKAGFLKAHSASVQRHVQMLASKEYQAGLSDRFDYIAMFIPGENFFAAALEHAPDLIERAIGQRVIVTTPTTLIALARTVAHLWRQNELNENAEKAARLGEELYSRISVLLGHIEKLGKSLNVSVETYNSVIGSVDRRVLPTLRRLEELSVAPPGRVPAQPQLIEARAGVLDPGVAIPDGPPGDERA